jgi:[protein-PII] uridylyltransferase
MHEVGFLGKYLPEFGKLTCLVQHEFYHRYTADEHTLVCLEKLDEIWGAETPPFSHYTQIFQHVERPALLYLALLLHDAGKASGLKGHSLVGGELAVRVARRLGLNPIATHTLRLVIEHHLLMAQISQRRDLDDPNVIRAFAEVIKTPDNLVLLTLHSFVDAQGTSDKLWNDFKESLLWALYDRTLNLLNQGAEFLRAEEQQREDLLGEVRRLAPRTIVDEELKAHADCLPPRYFRIHSAREILTDVALIHRFLHLQLAEEAHPLEPIVNWHNDPDRGYTAVKICTWNRAGLFSKIAGSLAAAGLNIFSAQIFSRNDGIILDTLLVNDAMTGKLANREEREKFERFLRDALTGAVDFQPLIGQVKFQRPIYQSVEGGQLPTVIQFDNSSSEAHTVIDIETEDRVGLLYVISSALAELGLDISLAKISTEKGAAIDSFYVNELDGSKVLADARLKTVERKLTAAIGSLDQPSRIATAAA